LQIEKQCRFITCHRQFGDKATLFLFAFFSQKTVSDAD